MLRSVRLLLLMLFAAGPAFAAPLDVYGRLPAVEDMAISPDGARLASIRTDGERRTIRIENLAQHKVERLLDARDAKLRGLMWVGPDHLVVLRSTTATILGLTGPRQEYLMGFEYNLTTGAAHPLMGDAHSALSAFWQPQVRIIGGKAVLFVQTIYFPQNQGVPTLYRINLDRDVSELAEQGAPETEDFVLGPDGQAVAQSLWSERLKRWSLKLKTNGFWREVRAEQTLHDTPNLIGLGRDGQSVLVQEARGDGYVVRELSPQGAWSDPLPVGDAEGLIFDPVRHNLIGYSQLAGDEQRTSFFDPRDQQVWTLVQHAYPNQLVRFVSWSDDRKKIVVRADSPTEGPGYALIDLVAGHADWLANEYADLGPDDLSPREPIAFKAADGTPLTGYLTRPRGREPKALPLIVFPHGGPEVRDEPGFDWWAQAMASRGYAVLQVNYRGSSGFGRRFTEAGYGQWGRKMQTDLSDGVRDLAARGVVDPKRVCIVGASYGGYAALAGPTLDPGVYRCAVSYAGPADLHAMVAWSESHAGERSERYWLRFMGARDVGDPGLREVSPAAHVDRVNVPMLLIHGKDDTVVPIEQSHRMTYDLKAAGKPVELMVLDSTDHWLTRGATRLQMLKATMAFVEKHNPPN